MGKTKILYVTKKSWEKLGSPDHVKSHDWTLNIESNREIWILNPDSVNTILKKDRIEALWGITLEE